MRQHSVHRAAELADDHTPLPVGDHGELVGLLADHGAHCGRDEHPVHLVADVLQGVLDDVERDVVYIVVADEVRGGLLVKHHSLMPPLNSL